MKKKTKAVLALLAVLLAGCQKTQAEDLTTEYGTVESVSEGIAEISEDSTDRHLRLSHDSDTILIKDGAIVKAENLERNDRLMITAKNGKVKVIRVIEDEEEKQADDHH